jgi:hypothetical protein
LKRKKKLKQYGSLDKGFDLWAEQSQSQLLQQPVLSFVSTVGTLKLGNLHLHSIGHPAASMLLL